jgi:glycosyltransferase 2 family protein
VTPDPAPPRRSWLRTLVSFAIGAGLLVMLLWHTGLDELGKYFDQIEWQSPLILIPYVVITITDAIAWRWSLSAGVRDRVPFSTLFFARMAGEAVNSVTPTATLGGEPVKAHLLRASGVAISDGLASIVVAKTALTIAQSLFTALGFVALLVVVDYVGLASLGFLLMMGVVVGFTYLLMHVQSRNPAGAVVRALGRFLPRRRIVERLEAGAAAIDERLADFYRGERGAFVRAIAWNFVGWLVGITEVQLIVTLIGHPISWTEAFVIEAVAQPIRAVAIVVPGGLGVQEWGGAAFCQWLGMPEPIAVTLWLLKRARETFFDLVGLLYLGWRTSIRRDA